MTNLRDKISDAIPPFYDDRLSPDDIADAILAALPDMIAPLDMPERRNNYWGHKGGYQVAHTNGDLFRVRLHGRVICKDIRGFGRAVDWANTHHRAAIMAALTGVAT
jgi:hypothetical protein